MYLLRVMGRKMNRMQYSDELHNTTDNNFMNTVKGEFGRNIKTVHCLITSFVNTTRTMRCFVSARKQSRA